MKYTVEIDNEMVPVNVRPLGTGRYIVQIGDEPAHTVDASVSGGHVHILKGNDSYSVTLGARAGLHQAHGRGAINELLVLDGLTARKRAQAQAANTAGGATIVRSPMPGRIVSVSVEVGDQVTPGQGVVIVEAMKMENELRAEIEGVVTAVHVKADDRVEGNSDLISLAPAKDADDE
jgi:biotin carboxyl carrier protein